MGTKPPLQEGDKLLARSPVSLTNTLATTANGGQDYIHNAQTQENHENSKRTIVASRVHSESATHRRTRRKHRAANFDSAHQRWLMSKQVSTTVYSTSNWLAIKKQLKSQRSTRRKLFVKHAWLQSCTCLSSYFTRLQVYNSYCLKNTRLS